MAAAALQLQTSLARAGKPVDMPIIHEVFLRAGVDKTPKCATHSNSEPDLDEPVPSLQEEHEQVYIEFEERFGHSWAEVMLSACNQADLSGREAANAVAKLQHSALVRRQEERYKQAVIDFDKARKQSEG